ncbi:MAG: glycyl-radical enzyme activating protein [Prevotella sp.]|nr:glycyl-radical enzyme activating protein [Prevotella sp.]
MTPTIFDIKRYAINDGPGIRTTLFMKGCPLRCVWCHNPESWSPEPQVLFKQSKCIGCNTCKREGFIVDECPATALEMCGREWKLDDLMAEVEKERAVMEDSGGGVTLCGGEPLMHPAYTLQLLRELGRRGFHRTVDTTLYATQDVVRAVAEACELLLVDLKLMDSEKHRLYTSVGNEQILQNIRFVAEAGYHFVIRIPLIEGINADKENMEATARFLSSLTVNHPPLTVHLLPYHDIGKDKHRRMMPPTPYNPQGYPMATPSEESMERCRQCLAAQGLQVIIGG